MYKDQVQRDQLHKISGSYDEFLKSLSMKAIIKVNDTLSIKRIAQLTQKTNQFNLTTRRYTETDITNFMGSDDFKVITAELIDKFGTNGIVSLIILKKEDNKTWIIDTFLQSCRVIGRTLEQTMLWYIINSMPNMEVMKAEYVKTKKNVIVEHLYEKMGFLKNNDTSSADSTKWYINCQNNLIEKSPWIEVTNE
jgi:FkbH-like protein